MLKHSLAVGDTLIPFAITITDDNNDPLNLTGKTVTFNMETLAGVTIVAAGTVTVTSAVDGECQYDFQAADVINAGTFKAWFVVKSGGESQYYPDDDDGIQITIFAPTADTTPAVPTIDIIGMANAPIRTRTVEGTVEERSINELIRADQYIKSQDAATAIPWGMRIGRTKPGGTTT